MWIKVRAKGEEECGVTLNPLYCDTKIDHRGTLREEQVRLMRAVSGGGEEGRGVGRGGERSGGQVRET